MANGLLPSLADCSARQSYCLCRIRRAVGSGVLRPQVGCTGMLLRPRCQCACMQDALMTLALIVVQAALVSVSRSAPACRHLVRLTRLQRVALVRFRLQVRIACLHLLDKCAVPPRLKYLLNSFLGMPGTITPMAVPAGSSRRWQQRGHSCAAGAGAQE